MGRRFNPRLAKLHRSYTVEEVARLLDVHKNTVRGWIKAGLSTIDKRRPTLIAGRDLRHYLEARTKKHKQPCAFGEFYCVKCRAPKAPAGMIADYIPITGTSGNLCGLCPNCGTLIYRRIAYAKLDEFRTVLDITVPQASLRIRETDSPSLNCDSKTESETYADHQSR